MRAYDLTQTRSNQATADELFAVHIWLASLIEHEEGTRRRRPEFASVRAYL